MTIPRRPSREQDTVTLVFDHGAATGDATTREFKTHPTRAFRVDGVDYYNATGLKKFTTLAYDGQTGNFEAGEVVTGEDSEATGTVVSDTDGGDDGVLILKDVEGTFEDDEALTGSVIGAAVVDGEQGDGASFAIELIAGEGDTVVASLSSEDEDIPADTFTAMDLAEDDSDLVIPAGSVVSLVLTETDDTTLPAGRLIVRGRYL